MCTHMCTHMSTHKHFLLLCRDSFHLCQTKQEIGISRGHSKGRSPGSRVLPGMRCSGMTLSGASRVTPPLLSDLCTLSLCWCTSLLVVPSPSSEARVWLIRLINTKGHLEDSWHQLPAAHPPVSLPIGNHCNQFLVSFQKYSLQSISILLDPYPPLLTW